MKKYLLLALFFVFVFSSFGQYSVNTAGGDISNNSGSVSYSIGQVVYQYKTNNTGSISQGVQQSYIISSLSLEDKKFHFSLNAYPNPTCDNLKLYVGNFNNESLLYKVFDSEGKLLMQSAIFQQETLIEMKALPSATYFVEVHHDQIKVQSFKIIKNL